MKKLSLIFLFVFLLVSMALAQVPNKSSVKSTAFQPYQQPSAPALAGLWVNINTGTFWVSGNPTTLQTVRLPMVPNTTNYIYVDLSLGTITSNTLGFTGNIYPVATAQTNGVMVLGLFDVRPDVFGGSGGGGGVGTITGIGTPAGSGLSGGGLSGTLNMSLFNGCSAGQVLQWDGSNWNCATNGSVTGVTAGDGLSKTGTTNPTLFITPCSNTQVLQFNGTWGCATISVSPGATNTTVQFNDSGVFNGDSTFSFNKSTHILTTQGIVTGSLTLTSPFLVQSSFPSSITCPNGFVAGQTCFGLSTVGHLGEAFNGSSTFLEFARLGASLSTSGGTVCADATGNLTQAGCTGGGAGIIVNPAVSQVVVQPPGTTLSANNFGGIRYISSTGAPYTWTSNGTGALTGGTPATITITCPLYGVFASTDTTSFFKIAGTGSIEYVNLTGGTCAPGTTTGTVSFTPAGSHSAGWTIGSASTGIQEAIIDAETNGTGTAKNNWRLIFSPSNPALSSFYTCSARVTIAGAIGEIDGAGAAIASDSAETCFYYASTATSVVTHGFRVASTTILAGAAITGTDCGVTTTQKATIQSTLNPAVNSWVDIELTDNPKYWNIHKITDTSGTNYKYADASCTGGGVVASQTTPGNTALLHTVFRDDGSKNTFRNITLDTPGWGTSNSLNHVIVVGDDESFLAAEINVQSGGVNCDANYCGDIIYNPGPFSSYPAVGAIENSNFSPGCKGNGITWRGGNTLAVKNSVIQGAGQYDIQTGTLQGGFGGTTLQNDYGEVGNCSNPLYAQAGLTPGLPTRSIAGVNSLAGVVTQNANIGVAGNLGGQEPQFGCSGGNTNEYWLVITDGTRGVAANMSPPLRFGQAGSTGTCTIAWPRYGSSAGNTVTYDILKTVGVGATLSAPVADGVAHSVAVATNVAQCAGLVCTASDTNGALSSYTVQVNPGLRPSLVGWPGSTTLGSGGLLFTNDLPITNLSSIVATNQLAPSVFADRCGAGTPGTYISCVAGNSSFSNNAPIGALLLQSSPENGAVTANITGRLSFPTSTFSSLSSGEIITLVPASPGAILADPNHRPAQNANDTYLGLDSGSVVLALAQLAIGAPAAISEYIGSTPDGTSWKRRTTATTEQLVVPYTGQVQYGVPLSMVVTTPTSDLGAYINGRLLAQVGVTNGAHVDLRGMGNVPTVTTDPFANYNTLNGTDGVIEWCGQSLQTDVPWVLPNKFKIKGCNKGDSGSNGTNSSLVATTTFRTNYPPIAGTGTATVCFDPSLGAPGNITVTQGVNSGGSCDTSGTGTFTPGTPASLVDYVLFATPNGLTPSPSNTFAVGSVKSVTDSKHLVVYRQFQSPWTIPSGGTGYQYEFIMPVVQVGIKFAGCAGVAGSCIANQEKVEDIGIDCNDRNLNAGDLHIGYFNMYGQENVWIQRAGIRNCNWTAIDRETTGAQNSGPNSDNVIGGNSLTTSISEKEIQTGYTRASMGGTSTGGSINASNLLIVNTVNSGGNTVINKHLESGQDGVTCGWFAGGGGFPWKPNGEGCLNAMFIGLSGNNTLTNVIHIVAATSTPPSNVQICTSVKGGATHLIQDDVHSTINLGVNDNPGPCYNLSAPTFEDGINLVQQNGDLTTGANGLLYALGTPIDLTGQTGSLTTQTLLAATTAAGDYKLNYYLDESAGCATPGPGAVTITLSWTDATTARTLTPAAMTFAVAAGSSQPISGTVPVRAASGSAITFITTRTACTTGTAAYDIHAWLTREQ